VAFGERVRVTFVNETMMAHPMHLHGMFFEVENGQAPGLTPEKNVIVVAPGRTQSIILTANEAGEWPLHCHLLFHMDSGMMKKLKKMGGLGKLGAMLGGKGGLGGLLPGMGGSSGMPGTGGAMPPGFDRFMKR